jgi:hypothetical protein
VVDQLALNIQFADDSIRDGFSLQFFERYMRMAMECLGRAVGRIAEQYETNEWKMMLL